MVGLVPAIYVLFVFVSKTWIAGTRSGMTMTILRGDGGRRRLAVEDEALRLDADRHAISVFDLAGQDQLGERILHRLLDHALERARAIGRIPTLVREPVARRG